MDFFEWDYSGPKSAPIGDHEVVIESHHLTGKHIALMVCGGIAAMKAPLIARALRRRGATVVAFCSDEALHYVGREALEWATCNPLITQLTWRAEHLSGSTPFDAYLIAPATYNTIGKIANGIADTVVTSAIASALGRMAQGATQIIMAPTMHGSMHQEILVKNCRALAAMGVHIISPRDDYGKHNLPDEQLLAAAVCRAISKSPLVGKKILVTAGPTPVPIDNVRRIVNRFSGKLGAYIHEDLLLRGAESNLVLGDSGWRPAPWIPFELASTFDDYRAKVTAHAKQKPAFGIFSAGVADYRPRTPAKGKIPSGHKKLTLDLEPTEKIIDLACAAAPGMFTVSFKYQENLTREELLAIARKRLDRYPVVVANRGEEISGDQQAAYIVTHDGETRIEGKREIAAAIGDLIEKQCSAKHRR